MVGRARHHGARRTSWLRSRCSSLELWGSPGSHSSSYTVDVRLPTAYARLASASWVGGACRSEGAAGWETFRDESFDPWNAEGGRHLLPFGDLRC